MWRICSKPTDYEQHVDELGEHLVKRGYDGEEIQNKINKGTKMTREQLLITQEKKIYKLPR